ncbi:SMP-30/Gluconolaconase/LRE-like region family protein [Paraburkholderia xenovorans LB400]|uniref:Xylono-1,4-lactonase n=1 Tax=Paraburkholderia xenovorans (strain LB400) TaxID=266265 RepID=Q13FC9_PARXL|nr:SMP-30/gluconolactonase/LRE family protein [Paraburkholderia xenovorans]ABE37210.1 Xylono-1,4-lactonase [Paraburkholderia xenovorans LB400]AIP34833.1 SMP-30/Gluconolaconase/LRE-like region family protein [Paraburkholderia xenovorans LB400]
MKIHPPVCVWPVHAELGEGPLWQAGENAVYFVDIKGRQIHRLTVTTGQTQTWKAPGQPGFIAPLAGHGFVCGLPGGLYRFDAGSGQFSKLKDVEVHLPGNRLNDGFVDASGHLWFGSMDDGEEQPSGTLYRVNHAGEAVAQDDGYVITNGPASSPDARTLYHGDTMRRVVYAFDLGEDGTLSRKRIFAAISGDGYPDGMAVDADGFLWVALFGGWRIERFSPDGKRVEQVPFPCANVTKLAFGGDDLQTVYASTAWKGLSPVARQQQPDAGGLFSFRSPVPGQPQARCKWGFAQ